jgi:hypothetical protein
VGLRVPPTALQVTAAAAQARLLAYERDSAVVSRTLMRELAAGHGCSAALAVLDATGPLRVAESDASRLFSR